MKSVNKTKILIMCATICLCSVLVFSSQVLAKTVSTSNRWAKVTDPSGYGPTQGMCRDASGNVYFAKIKKDDESKVKIYKINAETKTQKHLITASSDIFGHANDMTYCSKDGLIYISTGGGKKATHDIVAIDKKGNIVKKYNYTLNNPTGIAYDAANDKFYIKKGSKVQTAVLSNGKFSKKTQFYLEEGGYSDSNTYSRQGIAVYNGKIYGAYWNKSTRTSSAILKFNSSGQRLKTTTFNNTSRSLFEIEGLDFNSSGNLFFITNGSTSSSSSYDEVYKINNFAN